MSLVTSQSGVCSRSNKVKHGIVVFSVCVCMCVRVSVLYCNYQVSVKPPSQCRSNSLLAASLYRTTCFTQFISCYIVFIDNIIT